MGVLKWVKQTNSTKKTFVFNHLLTDGVSVEGFVGLRGPNQLFSQKTSRSAAAGFEHLAEGHREPRRFFLGPGRVPGVSPKTKVLAQDFFFWFKMFVWRKNISFWHQKLVFWG